MPHLSNIILPIHAKDKNRKRAEIEKKHYTFSMPMSGASFGQWKLPWGPTERQDSLAVLDWMTGQPWCNGKVCFTEPGCHASLRAVELHERAAIVGQYSEPFIISLPSSRQLRLAARHDDVHTSFHYCGNVIAACALHCAHAALHQQTYVCFVSRSALACRSFCAVSHTTQQLRSSLPLCSIQLSGDAWLCTPSGKSYTTVPNALKLQYTLQPTVSPCTVYRIQLFSGNMFA